ncbi:dCMP deaminase family protein [bacterium]|nr:dCMP deaminase family protein [bacterium]
MEIKPWDEYFLDLAKTCATRSNCIRAQVGAVIVGEDKKIKATGYNGTPSKVESCAERGECYRIKNNIPSGTQYETCRSIHAEQNAIIQAGQDRCKDATIYIWGHNFICILCKRFIVQSGIKNCVLKKDENSPIVRVSVEDLRRELEAQR